MREMAPTSQGGEEALPSITPPLLLLWYASHLLFPFFEIGVTPPNPSLIVEAFHPASHLNPRLTFGTRDAVQGSRSSN